MNSNKTEAVQNQGELSLWDLFSLLLKNVVFIIIIILVTTLFGVFYSFVIQEQNAVTYQINQLVIYDEWDYYPPAIEYTYANDAKAYINDEFDGEYITSAILKDSSSKDSKEDYNILIVFSTKTSEVQIKSITSKLAAWHNNMIEEGIDYILAYKENEKNELYTNYVNTENQYCEYLNENQSSSETNELNEEILKAKKNLNLELWKQSEQNIAEIKYSFRNAEYYYVNQFNVSEIIKNTWKNNIILSVAAGFALAIVFVLMKESYIRYKKDKNKLEK